MVYLLWHIPWMHWVKRLELKKKCISQPGYYWCRVKVGVKRAAIMLKTPLQHSSFFTKLREQSPVNFCLPGAQIILWGFVVNKYHFKQGISWWILLSSSRWPSWVPARVDENVAHVKWELKWELWLPLIKMSLTGSCGYSRVHIPWVKKLWKVLMF